MFTIELTDDYVEGEPGPNFYWRGSPIDYKNFSNVLLDLISTEGKLHIVKNKDFDLIGFSEISISVKENSDYLVHIDDDKVNILLDETIMKEVAMIFESISKCPSHNYVEFDELDLIEDANWIISSDCQSH